MNTVVETPMADELEPCIDVCLECHNVCMGTVVHCLQSGDKPAEHIRMLLDCADICQTSVNFMLRASDLHAWTCGTCARVCERCALDCEQYPNDDQMSYCAETCRTCAEFCRAMADETSDTS